MRVPAKFGFAAAAILSSTLGFASLTHAAPFAGVPGTVIAVQRTQMGIETDGLIQKAQMEQDKMMHGKMMHGKMMHGKMMHGKMMHHHHHHHHMHHEM